MKGKFIVIEGVDGSGKETQAKLLVKHLENIGTPVMYLDFPQYDGFYGQIIAKYLRGEFGQIAQISPYLVSIVYALDRSTVREKFNHLLKKGSGDCKSLRTVKHGAPSRKHCRPFKEV